MEDSAHISVMIEKADQKENEMQIESMINKPNFRDTLYILCNH